MTVRTENIIGFIEGDSKLTKRLHRTLDRTFESLTAERLEDRPSSEAEADDSKGN